VDYDVFDYRTSMCCAAPSTEDTDNITLSCETQNRTLVQMAKGVWEEKVSEKVVMPSFQRRSRSGIGRGRSKEDRQRIRYSCRCGKTK